ncbi:hypothetical protein [Gordonia alkanivorans]|uniref:hypothetical protein n=1 Tax=Gordonia alkanivorans TaxID=84096 RepID=UPI0005A98491|nr:hypothetical protein [Gordonia alkanivorans]
MRLGSIIVACVLFLGVLYYGAEGTIPAPDWLRGLWDRAWERQVEPRKEQLEQEMEKYRTTEPPDPQAQSAVHPETFSFTGEPGAYRLTCSLRCAV